MAILRVLGKGRRERLVGIGAKTVQALDRYLRARAKHREAHTPWLWLGRRGRLTDSGVLQVVQSRGMQAGLGDQPAPAPAAPQLRPRLAGGRRQRVRAHAPRRLALPGHAAPLRGVDRQRACIGGAQAAEPRRQAVTRGRVAHPRSRRPVGALSGPARTPGADMRRDLGIPDDADVIGFGPLSATPLSERFRGLTYEEYGVVVDGPPLPDGPAVVFQPAGEAPLFVQSRLRLIRHERSRAYLEMRWDSIAGREVVLRGLEEVTQRQAELLLPGLHLLRNLDGSARIAAANKARTERRREKVRAAHELHDRGLSAAQIAVKMRLKGMNRERRVRELLAERPC